MIILINNNIINCSNNQYNLWLLIIWNIFQTCHGTVSGVWLPLSLHHHQLYLLQGCPLFLWAACCEVRRPSLPGTQNHLWPGERVRGETGNTGGDNISILTFQDDIITRTIKTQLKGLLPPSLSPSPHISSIVSWRHSDCEGFIIRTHCSVLWILREILI